MIRWAEDSGGEGGGIWKRNMGDKGDGNTTSSPHPPPVGVVWSLRGNSDISMGMGWVGLTPPTPTQKVIIVLATAPTVLRVVMSSSTSSPLYFLDNDQQPT